MISCPSCNFSSVNLVGAIPPSDIFGGRILDRSLPGGQLYRCHICNLHFRYPQLDKEEMYTLYQECESRQWQYAPQHREDWMIAASVIRSHLSKGKILDVGCFDGKFLESLGRGYDIAGIELHGEAVRYAEKKGVRIVGHDYLNLHAIRERFDVVVATDVIEHTPHPIAFLNALSAVTLDGGIIIIATGNTEALPWKLMGSRYGYCAASEHVSFINPRWCQWAAMRLGLNVEISKTYRHAPVSFLKHIAGIGISLLYRVAPHFLAWLRRRGFGGVDVRRRSAMATYPPAWHGAVDHFVTVFRKK